MTIDRRTLLKGAGLLGTTVGLGLPRLARAEAPDFGVPEADPEGILDLPPGFSYTVLQRAGLDRLDNGWRVPGRPDGMACFEVDGAWVLLRNHELSPSDVFQSAYAGLDTAPDPSLVYDPVDQGGVTRLVVDPDTLEVLGSALVLAGTRRNCAGGTSPWGWLTCEENTDPGHGWVFACDASATDLTPPVRLDVYGRFNHEAVVVEPGTHIAYLSEDRGDGCLYRFVPDDPAAPHGAGRLQAMAVQGTDAFDTSRGMEVGDVVGVRWIDVTDNGPELDDLRLRAVQAGAAIVSRGEGLWYHDGSVYLCATDGGPARAGQVFRLRLDDMSLELLAQSTDRSVLDMPDNITVAPWGQVFLVEDGDGTNGIRVLAHDGTVRDFAMHTGSDSELAGVCFSPDGSTLFVNIQVRGLTLAVTGPFPAIAAEPLTDDTPRRGCDQTGGSRAGLVLATTLALLGLRAARGTGEA